MAELSFHPASYRDPSGFVFRRDGLYYRQVNTCYAEDYELLLRSGAYRALTEKGLLVPHTVVAEDLTRHPDRYAILLPEQIPFISYPEEWSPSQLKDAALLTLQVLHIAVEHGMILKDATPLNIQFHEGKAIFIDTLSFEKYDPSQPWIAYRQFCECFLYPLFLHHYLSTGTHILSGAFPEGIPASVTARMLPWKSRFRAGVWLHVLLSARIRNDSIAKKRGLAFDKDRLLHLTGNLVHVVQRIEIGPRAPSAWHRYYSDMDGGSAYLQDKERLLRELTADIDPSSVLDLGSNDGRFSKILAEKGVPVIAVDSDWPCIDELYRTTRLRTGNGSILPLCVDIADPTPAGGFAHTERASFTERFAADLVTALALVHHLAIGRNIPLARIASWLALLTRNWLILEFVAPSDAMAIELISNRRNQVPAYDRTVFDSAFGQYFDIDRQCPIPGTERTLYRMKKNRPL